MRGRRRSQRVRRCSRTTRSPTAWRERRADDSHQAVALSVRKEKDNPSRPRLSGGALPPLVLSVPERCVRSLLVVPAGRRADVLLPDVTRSPDVTRCNETPRFSQTLLLRAQRAQRAVRRQNSERARRRAFQRCLRKSSQQPQVAPAAGGRLLGPHEGATRKPTRSGSTRASSGSVLRDSPVSGSLGG